MAIVDVFPLGARVASTAGGGGATTALENRKLFDGVTGTPAFAAHPDGLGQHSALRNNQVSTFASINLGNAPTKIAFGFSFWAVTNPVTGAFQLMSALTAAASRHHIRWQNAAGNAVQAVAAGGTAQDWNQTLAAATRYWIDVLVDVSGGTHTVDWYVNGVKQTQSSVALAASTISSISIGNVNATGTADCYVADAVVYDSADFPLGASWVFDMLPTASGTHSSTAGDFTDDASAAVNVGETTSWAKLDEWPANTTDFVRQAVARTTSYLEYVLQTCPLGYSPKFFKLVAANVPASALALEMGLRLAVNGNVSAEAVIDASVAATTLEYHTHGYVNQPGSVGRWDRTSIDKARPRIGFSNDVSPLFNLTALLGQVVAQAPALPGPRNDSKIVPLL